MNRFPVYSLLLILTSAAFAGSLNSVIALPNQGQVNVMVRDSAGNLYLGGGALYATITPGDTGAFVTKLSSDGTKVIFQTKISTNVEDGVTALAIAPDGSILAAGVTGGNFPVTPDAAEAEPAALTGQPAPTGFFARLNPSGSVTYASYLNAAQGDLNSSLAIATDSTGAAYVTGAGIFDSTPGALPQTTGDGGGYFTVKLDQTGKQVWATGGIGGTLIVVDPQGSIYIAGFASGFPLPVTPGAFQPVAKFNGCSGGAYLGFACPVQYVAKLDPLATHLLYCTWLAGSDGAAPSSLTIDNQGNAILTGTTQSFDYPVTTDAFQTVASASQPLMPPSTVGPGFFNYGPPYTGYVTKLNAAGTGLVFSTYLGGSAEDTVDAADLDSEGNVYLAGLAGSPDFPGVSGIPAGCRPNPVFPTPYLTRLSADGSSLTATELPYGLTDIQGFDLQNVLALFDGLGNATIAFNGSLASLSLFGETQRFACAVDAADLVPLSQIAPGQLLTLLGDNIGASNAVVLDPQNGLYPVSVYNAAVKIHGIPAPFLYMSLGQINVQVPYEIAGETSVALEIYDPNGNVAGTRQFGVVARQPSAFTTGPVYAACAGQNTTSFLAVALNPDGSLNSCTNPAAAGSTITFFVNGLGAASAGLKTGAIATKHATPLTLPIAVSGDAQFVSAESVPGSSNSVWAVKVTAHNTAGGFGPMIPATFTLTIGGVPLRDPLVVWVKTP